MNSTYATRLSPISQTDVSEHEKHFTGLGVTCVEVAHGILQANHQFDPGSYQKCVRGFKQFDFPSDWPVKQALERNSPHLEEPARARNGRSISLGLS